MTRLRSALAAMVGTNLPARRPIRENTCVRVISSVAPSQPKIDAWARAQAALVAYRDGLMYPRRG